MNTKILFPVSIVIAGVLIAGVVFYVNRGGAGNILSAQEASQKAIDYINQNLISGQNTASLTTTTEVDDFYKIRLKVGNQEFDSYITKDGKYLFPTGYDLTVNLNTGNTNTTNNNTKATCESLKKADKPTLEAFIVSNCPYGLQMQRILNEIVANIPSLAENIKVEYIGAIEGGKITSMHGDTEAQENLRQICIREEQNNKYWNYAGCYIKKGDTQGCLTEANIDKTKLNTCMTDAEKGLKYAAEDFAAQKKYSVSGSPTLFLNGTSVSEFDFGGRTAEAAKTLICCGNNTTPSSCSQKLNETSAAAGLSETYAGSGGSSSGGCE